MVGQGTGRPWSRYGTSSLQIPEFSLVRAGGSLDFSSATTPTPPESPGNFDYSPRKPLVRAGSKPRISPTARSSRQFGRGSEKEEIRGWDDEDAVEYATPSVRVADVSHSVDHSAQGNDDDTFDVNIPLACSLRRLAEAGADLYPRLDTNSPPEPSANLGPAQGLQNPDRDQFTRHIFTQQYESVTVRYSMQQVLGTGAMGEVWKCVGREDGRKWACKTIQKARLQSSEDVEALRNEVAVMLELADHTAVVGLHDVVEDEESVNLVTELCEGGDLYDSILRKRRYSEADSACVIRSIISVIHFMQANEIMHRDLKPENVVLRSTESDTSVCVIDFGQAASFTRGKSLSALFGSTYYVAPEVLKKNYGPEADMWSAGVILYAMLSGSPPFWAEDRHCVREKIMSGRYDLEGGPWRRISGDAKDLVLRLLCMDARERITPIQAKRHPWILRHCIPHSPRVSLQDKISTLPSPCSVLESLTLQDQQVWSQKRTKINSPRRKGAPPLSPPLSPFP